MGCGRGTFKRNWRNRRGLSFVEFIGCMFALSSGVALGSVYLGVDMKTMLVGILERAELVEPGFFGSVAAAETGAEDYDLLLVGTSGEAAIDNSAESSGDWTEEQRLTATEMYWEGFTTSIRGDVSHRKLDSRSAKKWRLFDYLSHRRKGHENVVKAIEALDRPGVDQRLLEHSDQVLDWHRTGWRVYTEAVKLLTDAPGDQLSGPLAEEWRSSATQHRMEERLVREKHAAVASYLDHAFHDAAPFKRGF